MHGNEPSIPSFVILTIATIFFNCVVITTSFFEFVTVRHKRSQEIDRKYRRAPLSSVDQGTGQSIDLIKNNSVNLSNKGDPTAVIDGRNSLELTP